tara:strand:- start:470 stop:1063 length:594 start_codon:yes stop_codon:yes gene_type:complete
MKPNLANIKLFFFENTNEDIGMSMVETIISLMLLSLFLTIYSGFVQVSNRFSGQEVKNLNSSNGLVVDHHKLYLALDKYSEILAQPAITLSEINTIKQLTFDNLPAGCSYSPSLEWKLPITQNPIPGDSWKPSTAGYAICLKSTSIYESSLTDLVSYSKGIGPSAQPGIYFLLALPSDISINSLPVRKMFCRPDPFC